MTKKLPTNAEAAADLTKRVGQTKLAARFNTSRQAIDEWKKRGVPLPRVNDVAQFAGIPVAEIIPETARHVSTVLGRDCAPILGELIKAFY